MMVCYLAITLALAVCLGTAPLAVAVEASKVIFPAADAHLISPRTDHYSVSLLRFWVSTKDSWFKRLFSDRKDGAVTVKATTVPFDDDSKKAGTIEFAHPLKNLAGSVNRPIGLNATLVESIPADANIKLTMQVALFKGNRIDEVLKGLEESKAGLPADIFASQWLGYTKAASIVIEKLFAISETQYPFAFVGDVKASAVNADGEMKAHYILLIAPNEDNDTSYKSLATNKLTYDEMQGRVVYDGKDLTDWSHAVLKISKAPAPNIAQLAFESEAPWAVLVQSQFVVPPAATFTSLDQVKSAAEAVIKALQDVTMFLKKEPRFSKFDRAAALRGFALSALKRLRTRCNKLAGGTDATCGLNGIAEYAETVDEMFGLILPGAKAAGGKLDKPTNDRLNKDADAIAQAIENRASPKPPQ